ncbi:MAG: hypothetical protein HY220_01890 [Candidatus Sungbacteria bacterium]|uniref:Uncharacterized protein n=1 Tax=Candidatus Sungiibacteriota bacterium TaxID=2750080 RepID=A0A9D6LMZ9_9BACT|nr:hypothetical protein [Candidatus Sungbacteria bacterium]
MAEIPRKDLWDGLIVDVARRCNGTAFGVLVESVRELERIGVPCDSSSLQAEMQLPLPEVSEALSEIRSAANDVEELRHLLLQLARELATRLAQDSSRKCEAPFNLVSHLA